MSLGVFITRAEALYFRDPDGHLLEVVTRGRVSTNASPGMNASQSVAGETSSCDAATTLYASVPNCSP